MTAKAKNMKIAIVTGANSGIGKAITKKLVSLDIFVIMVARDEERGKKALIDIKHDVRKENIADLMLCDFASQESIRSFAKAFKEKYDQLDILINNHGAMFNDRQLTEDGIERTFAVNHLGYFLLTNLLLDHLKKSDHARIVNTSSGAHKAVRKWNLEDYNYDERKYRSFTAYGESKLYNIMLTYYLADKVKHDGIIVNTFNPGFTSTNFGSDSKFISFIYWLMSPFAKSPAKAARTGVYLALSKEVADVTGKYFEKMTEKKSSELSYEEDLQKELWELSSELVDF
jgi:NAD(P)-dependent dehydrogenase (short-subunit alcohol dehydrogenase family)